MCFSATGSFVIGSALIAAGAYTIKIAAKKDKSYIPFASIPIIFGTQQIIEGFVWLGLLHGNPMLVKVASLMFTFFALGLWPFFAPFSMLFVKEKRRHELRGSLYVLACIGAFIGIYSYIPILFGMIPLTTKIIHHSISYNTRVPYLLKDINSALYLYVVITPFMIVPSRRIKAFALLLLVSSIIASHFFFGNYISVWCLFASILSFDIMYILKKLPKR